MITSVTSATAAAIATLGGWDVALGAGGAVLVIGLLIAMELAGATEAPRVNGLRKVLFIATGPLVLVFVVSIVAKAVAILGAQT